MRQRSTLAATTVLAVVLATALTGCKLGGSTANPSPSGVPAAPPAGDASPSAPALPEASGSAVTTLDPCALFTRDEASALVGVTFTKTTRDDVPGGERRCIYNASGNTFTVIVVQAASVAQAQTEKDKVLADAQQNLPEPATLTPVPGLADDAQALTATFSGPTGTLSLAGLYVLRGTVGFGLVDTAAGTAVPGTAALVTQARTVLGRLP